MATVKQILTPEEALFHTGTAFGQYVRINGTDFPVTGIAFDGTASERVHFHVVLPNYGSGNLYLDLYWYADTATTGSIVFQTSIAAISPDSDTVDIETKSLATAQTGSDTHLGTTGQRLHTFQISITNLDSIAANDYVNIMLCRLPADAGDTMAGDCIVTSLTLSYSDT